MARWMSCLSPGPARERIFTTPGVPPIRCEPRPVPAWPLTISCLVSWSNHIVVLSASSSSFVSQSLACSQIQGGSVTCASQSKVGKSLVIGANFWVGIRSLLWDIGSKHGFQHALIIVLRPFSCCGHHTAIADNTQTCFLFILQEEGTGPDLPKPVDYHTLRHSSGQAFEAVGET